MARNLILVPLGEHHKSTGKLKKSAKHELKKTRKAIEAAHLGETAVVLTADTKRHHKAANILAKAFVKSSVEVVPEIYGLDKETPGKGSSYRSTQADRWLKVTPDEANQDSAVVVIAGSEYVREILATQTSSPKTGNPSSLTNIDTLKGNYDGNGEPLDINTDVKAQAVVYDPSKKSFKPLEMPQEQMPKAA